MDPTSKVLLTPKEVVALGFAGSKSTLRRLVMAGQFPKPIKASEGRVAYRRADLDAWLEQRAEAAT